MLPWPPCLGASISWVSSGKTLLLICTNLSLIFLGKNFQDNKMGNGSGKKPQTEKEKYESYI
jgi:hypothetical protein